MDSPNAVDLDPTGMVALWRKDSSENIKPSELRRLINPKFRGWYWCGGTSLELALADWRWNQENMGKTFADSIYVVSPVWIFPVDFEVPQDF